MTKTMKTITVYEIDRPVFSALAPLKVKGRHAHDLDRPDPSVQKTRLTNCDSVYATAAVFRRGGKSGAWQDDKGAKPRKGDTLNCVMFVKGATVQARTPIIGPHCVHCDL